MYLLMGILVWSLAFLVSSVMPFSLPEKYESSIRPNDGGIADVVNVAMNILSIRDVDEENQKFSVDFQIRTFWVDKRLANLVERESVFVDKIPDVWTPQLSISNMAKPPVKTGKSVSLKYDGTLNLSERFSATVSCPMNMLRYPFGKQTCQIQLNSNGYSTLHIVLIWNGIISPDNIKTFDAEYSLHHIDQSSEREKTPSGEFSYINVDIVLTRSPWRIIFRAILPTFIFAVLSYYITFFLRIRKSQSSQDSTSQITDDTTLKKSGDFRHPDEAQLSTQNFQTKRRSLSQITFEIVRVSTNAFLLLVVILIKQISFLKTPRSRSPTALDAFTGLMSFFIFISLVLSLHMCFRKWKKIAENPSLEEETGQWAKKVRKVLKISIPVVFLVFLIAFLGFCLS